MKPTRPDRMDLLPASRLHSLKGNPEGFWAVSISGNWRIIFRFEGGHACDVDLTDYHWRISHREGASAPGI